MNQVPFVMLIALLSSCAQESMDSESKSLVSTQGKWKDPTAIPVCIMNRGEVDIELLNDLKSHVVNDYSTSAGIGLVGWKDCTATDKTSNVIRITFRLSLNWHDDRITAGGGESQVGSSRFACDTDCRGGTMRLDIGSNGKYPTQVSKRAFAIQRTRATAIHEFGHALGLMHEHERSDAPGCSDYNRTTLNSDPYVYVGNFDANSIMNYCHNPNLTTLSKGDIAGLKYLYPQLAPGSAMSALPSNFSQTLHFGPFPNNENFVLTTLTESAGHRVNFTITLDVENHSQCSYDYAFAEDSNDWKSSKLCGKSIWKMTNLATPVKIYFRSDSYVTSQSVKISRIEYARSAAADLPREDHSIELND